MSSEPLKTSDHRMLTMFKASRALRCHHFLS
jgi:hypothetical protein